VKKKIRDAQIDLIPYMLVVGPKDQQQGGVSVRDRIDGDLGFMSLQGAITKLTEERDSRTIRQVTKRPLATAASEGAAANEY
jgi:threonyl-tRNA synthetase